MDVIMKQGSCAKRDMYETIISLLKANGWTDISTNIIADGNVMMSTGVSGTQRLILQLRPNDPSNNFSYNVKTTDYCQASYRMGGDYTPGSFGTPGVFNITLYAGSMNVSDNYGTSTTYPYVASNPNALQWNDPASLVLLMNADPWFNFRYTASVNGAMVQIKQNKQYEQPFIPTCGGASIATVTPGTYGTSTSSRTASELWKPLFIFPYTAAYPKDTNISYKYHCNANRLILAMEYTIVSAYMPIVMFMGLPDEYYCSEPGTRGVIFGSTYYNDAGANFVSIMDNPGELSSLAMSTTRSVYSNLAPKSPNSAGKYIFSELFYGNSTDGIRGKIPGIYAIPGTGLANGDIIQVGSLKYYALACSYGNSTGAFQSYTLLVLIP